MDTVQALVICLESRRKDRCDVNFDSYRSVFPRAQRMVAVDAKNISMRDPRISPFARQHITSGVDVDHLHMASKGAVGCYLSHMACWKRCVDSQQPCVVIEDDMYFDERKKSMLTEAYNSIPKDAEFASLIYIPMSSGGTCADGWCTISARTFAGTQCYYITPAGAQKLLRQALPMITHVDVYIGYIGEDDPDFKAYRYEKKIYGTFEFLRDNMTSSIGHAPQVKKLLPESNWFYGSWSLLTLLLVITTAVLVFRRR